MTVSLRSLGIDRLGFEDRLTLVQELWDNIADHAAAMPLTEAQQAELERRIAEHEANPDDAVSWEEIRESIGQRLQA
ncbi:MAG: addiction module protein [Candidatus Accumulibacter sp.]|uniref:addiction module protein n=1 Tax=Accumulibacter sp. TaxID=2053492 RepID=UPI001A3D9171|nr:addiction module protein [Accumulibacter sp.]MBL8394521.1 addiction module protein [Accumulibacter sp.]